MPDPVRLSVPDLLADLDGDVPKVAVFVPDRELVIVRVNVTDWLGDLDGDRDGVSEFDGVRDGDTVGDGVNDCGSQIPRSMNKIINRCPRIVTMRARGERIAN